MSSKDLLLEIGAEELPASFVTHALDVMKSTAEKLFGDARLAPSGAIRTYGTPRRLALVIPGIPDTQPDRKETVMGPPASAGLKPDGSFGPAAEGFAKKQGATIDAVRVVETPKGKYLAVDIEQKGRATSDVLQELLATLCQKITFPKAMRWGAGDFAFGRPIHWIVALHGSEIIPFAFAGITSDRTTRGHRFLAPATFAIESSAEYLGKLRDAHVLADLDERRSAMVERLHAAAAEAGGVLEEDEFLLGECLSLVEEPHIVPGTIDERFTSLPDDVIVSVMRTHQRYFAVRSKDGTLLQTYLNVVNTANDPARIAKGNDRVLRARLNDAAFFVREDLKKKVWEDISPLDRVVFQAKLGSVGAKVRRVQSLASEIAPAADKARAFQAAALAKADLLTHIVGEFPELQGNMGRWYANHAGIDPIVADAIRDHYKPAGAADSVPSSAVAAAVAIADRLDTLVGCFAIGLVPSGSADPFALRRAALGVVRIGLDGPIDADIAGFTALALDHFGSRAAAGESVTFPKPNDAILATLATFFRGRLEVYFRDTYPGDVVDAALAAWDGRSIRDLRARMVAVNAFRAAPEFESLAIAFKRAWNIAKDVVPEAPVPAKFEPGPESALGEAFFSVRTGIEKAVSGHDYDAALRLVASTLRGPIDTFFEKVFVMVEDEELRTNRLRLLRSIADVVRSIVHVELLAPS